MDRANMLLKAQSLTRAAFAKQYTGLYLVTVGRLDAGQENLTPLGFQTDMREFDSLEVERAVQASSSYLVMELIKSPQNPYLDRISVGRARICDIVIRHASVSKLHAHFRRTGPDRWELVDLGSQNGTRVRGQLLEPHKPEAVAPDVPLQFGTFAVKLVDGGGLFDLLGNEF
jgi:hypothetical protein